MDGIPKSILGLVWKIILNFDSIETKKDLLEWVQRVTREYEGVVVKDFTHSWKNGRAFCAIISKHRLVVIIIAYIYSIAYRIDGIFVNACMHG